MHHFPRCLTALGAALLCLNVDAQVVPDVGPSLPVQGESTMPPCPRPDDKDCPNDGKRKEEDKGVDRTSERASPQIVGDAPMPPQGAPPPPPRFVREPLRVRRHEFSLSFDHALSPEWAVGGLAGVARGSLRRHQTEFAEGGDPNQPGLRSDTTVHTRSNTLAAALTHFPQPDVFIDTTLSWMQTDFDVSRIVSDTANFVGRHAGSSVALSLAAGKVWRGTGWALVPQAGLDYVDSRVDALETNYYFTTNPEWGTIPGFQISAQRSKTLTGVLGLQIQWPHSTGFGTATPYLSSAWRERLWMRAAPVVATVMGADPRTLDAEALSSRRGLSLATGLLAQFQRGVSAFIEFGLGRGAGQLHEIRGALGLKFEQ